MKRCLVLTVMFFGLVSNASGQVALEWTEFPELPPRSGATVQPGVAGAFAGISNDALILAGGASFFARGYHRPRVAGTAHHGPGNG